MKKHIIGAAAVILLTLTGCSATTTDTASPAPAATADSAAPAPAEEAAADAPRTVTYDVTSDAATAGNVTYMTFNDGGSGTEQATDAAVPFTKSVEIADDGMFEMSIFSLTAQASAEATTITCKITVDGQVISEQTSTGQYAVVSCSGSPE